VKAYKKIFSGGYHHLTHGRTTTLPANYATAGLQSGSFMATRFQNGKRLKSQARFYGSMGNVCFNFQLCGSTEIKYIFLVSQRALEKVSFGT
jgi:hypothetical protein